MVIRLKQELIINSHKTIDGHGASVHIAGGACIAIHHASNIIVHGIHIHDCVKSGNAVIRDSPSHAGWWEVSDGDDGLFLGATPTQSPLKSPSSLLHRLQTQGRGAALPFRSGQGGARPHLGHRLTASGMGRLVWWRNRGGGWGGWFGSGGNRGWGWGGWFGGEEGFG
ncbi:probable pectate lyase 5 [Phtheirospermum japonicum]|uniref:Probable pectate lyase 5 n=1 Tax=Phtheirospermum japonicum TaxID=374723 RepID=A0A830BHI6_9LAMI|nr:probable pectate lyase 5 [Phtheirospermum japonicum]